MRGESASAQRQSWDAPRRTRRASAGIPAAPRGALRTGLVDAALIATIPLPAPGVYDVSVTVAENWFGGSA